MPKLCELAEYVVGLVSEELDVSREEIVSRSRRAEVVDARHMAAKLLYVHNVYPRRIARIFGLSPRSIQYALTSFEGRMETNRGLRSPYARVAKALGEKRGVSAK